MDILAGQKVVLQITWKNVGLGTLSPFFRADIKQGGLSSLFTTWKEGWWAASPSANAEETVTATVKTIAVPADWGAGQLISLKLIQGKSGDFRSWDSILQIPLPQASLDNIEIVGDILIWVE